MAQSFGGLVIGEGDEIVLSIMEHHSNIVPWHFHRERRGAVIKWAPIDDDGNFLLDEFEKLLGPRTKIVAITQMSNALGTIVPIKEVIRIAHARGIPVLVDGSQAAVHMPVDVQDLDADFYVFTGHKTYGPTGIGVLYGKTEHLQPHAALPGRRRDDQRSHASTASPTTSRRIASRRERPAIVQAIGLGAALDYMTSIGLDDIAAHEADLRDYAMAAPVGDQFAAHLWPRQGQGRHRLLQHGTGPMPMTWRPSSTGQGSRSGPAPIAPSRCCTRFGVTATCRASFAMYNTREEVDKLAEALISAQRIFL